MNMNTSPTPFTILALSAFGQGSGTAGSLKMIDVHQGSLDDAVAALSGTLSIPVPREICPAGSVIFSPTALKDFRPREIVKRISYLRNLADAGKYIETAAVGGNSDSQIAQGLKTQWPDLPIDFRAASASPKEPRASHTAVDDILSMVAMPGGSGAGARSGQSGAKAWKEQIDSVTARVLEAVFNHAPFRSLEASWRGVEILVSQGPVKEAEGIVLKCAPIDGDMLGEALDSLSPGLADAPPNLILIDHAFDNTPAAIALLEKVAEFASTLLVPVVVWLGPWFFHLDTWNALKKLPYLNHYLEDAAYAKWRKLKKHPGSDWLVMTANRFLVRASYGNDNPPRTVCFSEQHPLWVSPVWALGTLVGKSVTAWGWPTRFTDYRNISLEDLAAGEFAGEGSASTETVFSEDRILQMVEAGITPLTGALKKDFALVPKETTLSGGSLKFQLFFNRIVGYLFYLKEVMGNAALQADPGARLAVALAELFRQTGHQPPEDLSIRADPAEEGKPTLLRIAFTPPVSILPGTEPLQFTLTW